MLMCTYTEMYSQINGKWQGIKDISACRFMYLVNKGMKWDKKRNRNKYNVMKKFVNSHNEFIVYNPDNFQNDVISGNIKIIDKKF